MAGIFGYGRKNVVSLAGYRGEMRFPVLNEVEAYWEALRMAGSIPRRADVDPRGLERALSDAFILERVAPGLGRFRLAGHDLTDLMGMDVRGMPLSAFFLPESRDLLAEQLEQVFRGPAVLRMTLAGPRRFGRAGKSAALIVLPLCDDMGVISRGLGCLVADPYPIAKPPYRFAIEDVKTRALTVNAPNVLRPPEIGRHIPRPDSALAEDAVPFAPAPPQAKGPNASRPALRVITSDD